MKNPWKKSNLGVFGVYGLILVTAAVARGAEPTAFELIKQGNRYVGEQSKDKVIEIHSDKSVGGLAPNIWYVTYYDPDSKSKLAEVKFGAGQQLGVKRGWRPLESSGAAQKVMDPKQLKIDSDQAIKIATAEPILAKLTLKATELKLEAGGGTPIWHVTIYAAKLSKPEKMVDIGEVTLSADTGQVTSRDLKINKVD